MASLPDQFREQYADGIRAGSTHFDAVWARDSLFACFGALALKDYDIVRKNLDLLLNNLQDGHVALRIGYKSQLRKYLGLPSGNAAVHNQDKGSNESYDANSLLLVVAEKYEHETLKKLDREKLVQVTGWLDRHDREHLLHEGPYSSWEDSLNLTGPRLYTNVCYYRALAAAAKLFKDPVYATRAVQTKIAVRRWWNGTYFTDGPNRDVCMTAGNLLAILWGIADPQQSRKILEYMSSRKTMMPPASDKPAKKNEVPWYMRLIGLGQYHGTMEWSWLAAAEIACYHCLGEHDEAYKRDTRLRELIEEYGSAYELWEHDVPVKKLFYKSEKDFSWTMGLLIASQPATLSILR